MNISILHGGWRTPNRKAFSVAVAAVLLLSLAALSGCGEARVDVVPVSGKVSFAGRAPAGAQIVLHPVNRAEPSDVVPSGRVANDGSFTITAYQQGDGAPPGQYIATLQWYRVDPKDGTPGPNVIPEQYGSAATSPLKVTVKSEPTVLDPIAIVAGKPGRTAARPVAARR